MFQSPLPRTSSFSQSTMTQSSSSTETSPDSFPDLSPQQFIPEFRPESRKPGMYQRNSQWRPEQDQFRNDNYDSFRATFETRRPATHSEDHSRSIQPEPPNRSHPNQHPDWKNLVLAERIYETSPIARQRPIIGRKIMATTEAPQKTINEFPIWQPDLNTPPQSLEHKHTQNFYELFPSENRGFELPSSIKTPSASPQQGISRNSVSPRAFTPSVTPPRPIFFPRMTRFKEPLVGPSTTYGSKMCTFCRKNGETPCVYNTHTVKEKVGNKNVVTCPILRSHVCSTCGASGDDAHTM